MPYIYEPVVHNYQDRGVVKRKTNIQLLNIVSKNKLAEEGIYLPHN